MEEKQIEKIVERTIRETLVRYQDRADSAACDTFSKLMKEVSVKLDTIAVEVTKNTNWRKENKDSVNEIRNFLQFLKYGKKFGLGSASVIAIIGVIMGAVYTVKEWIKR